MKDFCALTESREGRAVIRHCDLSAYADSRGYVDPTWAPVFYNPRMKCSRDLSTVILSAYLELSGKSGVSVIDVMCGTGARGIRYALEVPGVSRVILNDINPKAAALTRENVSLNGITDIATISNMEAHALLSSTKADIIDIDPFGTPAPFIHPALRAVKHGGLLCVTATDLPPLLGVYPSACMRKYFSFSIETEFSREQGVRILLYLIAREAAKLGRVIKPFYSYYLDHHIRVCVIVEKREKKGFLEENIGFIFYNPHTLERRLVSIRDMLYSREKLSSSNTWKVGGPVWASELWNREATRRVHAEYSMRQGSYALCRRGLRLAERIESECGMPPLYYTTEKIASTYKLDMEQSPQALVEKLVSKGYPSSLTHFDPKGFRAADISVVLENWY